SDSPAQSPSTLEATVKTEAPPAIVEQAPITPAALRANLETDLKIESPAAREKALAIVAWNALDIDPDLASEAFLKLRTDSVEKIRLIQHYAMRLAEQDMEAAIAWARNAGSELEIAAASSQIAIVLSETDPRRAAVLLSETGVDGRDFDVAVVQVLQRWATQSAADAAAWAASFQPGAARQAGITHIVSQWMLTDAPAAFGWLNAIKDRVVRKEALLAIEKFILQQPRVSHDTWLQYADSKTRKELDLQRQAALAEVGHNVP
ncbi:MAG: hypothetical protein K8R87_03995, partial [Verrucomicrobia bacterium]|nr:hypothetical protein [Verrucomicrobiota bacterium]